MYIHERKEWPDFTWNKELIADLLNEVRFLQGQLLGRMRALGFHERQAANLQILIQDVLKTSEIEGETLNAEQVRSSLAKRLGIDDENPVIVDKSVDGIVEMELDAVENYASPLSIERLFTWHTALFPTGQSGMQKIIVGAWRDKESGSMRVISGPIGREKVHFEAPEYQRLPQEMQRFITWFNRPDKIDLLLKSALAHFWFVTIHPFEDGNGRIARVIADMLLARSEESSQRFYSMSAQIQRERKTYYDILEYCQKGELDITLWLEWYLSCLKRAIHAANEILFVVLSKAKFWALHNDMKFNARQQAMLNRLFDGFYGKLTSSKWAKIAKCSQDTALRDINDLVAQKILIKDESGGRSTSYKLSYEWNE